MARKEEPFLISSTALSVLAVVGLLVMTFGNACLNALQ